ncbi:hypothetical protein P5W02_17615 [Mycobacteroides abscessus subsp. abscessus]|nr:hypothetical protein [Mycobacteroides abscessus]MDO3104573.1 hypothetical protein [Mycobacteroides abscessus subsp. abscessus]
MNHHEMVGSMGRVGAAGDNAASRSSPGSNAPTTADADKPDSAG